MTIAERIQDAAEVAKNPERIRRPTRVSTLVTPWSKIRNVDKNETRRLRGVFEIALSGFGFGFLGVFGKLLFASGLTIGELLAFRFLLAALFLFAGLLLGARHRLRLSLKQIGICALLGILGYAVFSTLYFRALQGVSVALASMLLYTYPVMVTLGVRFIFSEPLSRAQWLALPLTITGLLILLNGEAHISSYWAVTAGLGAALCYTIYILASSRLQADIDPLSSGFYVIGFAGLGHLAFHHPDLSHIMHLTVSQWLWIAGIALVSTVGPMVLFLSGLQKIGNAQASLISTMEPLTAAVAGAMLFGEKLTVLQLIGGVLILASLAITALAAPTSVQSSSADRPQA